MRLCVRVRVCVCVTCSDSCMFRHVCAALDANDYNTAGELQVALTTHDWEENSTWIVALKRLMDLAKQSGR